MCRSVVCEHSTQQDLSIKDDLLNTWKEFKCIIFREILHFPDRLFEFPH